MSIYGALGEPMSDHLDPPAWYDCDDEDDSAAEKEAAEIERYEMREEDRV